MDRKSVMITGGRMKISSKVPEHFMLQLVREFLPAMENQEENVLPISDREFYSIFGMIVAALLLLAIIFHGLSL
jgi:hypothetical protein